MEIVTWAERPELARGLYEVALEALPDIPGLEDDDIEPFDDWLAHDMQGAGDRPEATFVALAGEQVVGLREVLAHGGAADDRLPRPVRRQASVAWPWHRAGAEGGADQLGARQRLHELHTRNEQRNEPIRRLNAAFGYRPGIGRIYLVGALAVS